MQRTHVSRKSRFRKLLLMCALSIFMAQSGLCERTDEADFDENGTVEEASFNNKALIGMSIEAEQESKMDKQPAENVDSTKVSPGQADKAAAVPEQGKKNAPLNQKITQESLGLLKKAKDAVVLMIAATRYCLGGYTVNVGGRQRPLVGISDISGSLEYTLDQQKDTQSSAGGTSESDSRLMTEQLNLLLKGDVFDPRLMSYSLFGGFGVSQQTYNTNTQSSSSTGDLLEYGLNANFLPTKPYPFGIEASQSEQLLARSFQSPLRVKASHEGFHLNLRVPDWPMTFSWSHSQLTQDSDTVTEQYAFDRTMERFSYTLSHKFNDDSRMTFRSDLDQSSQTSGSFDRDVKTQRHRLLHYLNFGYNKEHRLDSSFLLVNRQDQFDSSTFDWTENLYLKHSETFSTFYNTVFSKSTFDSIDSQTMTGLTGFTHQLYLNLVTNADVYVTRSEFGSINETTTQGADLRFNYRRNNPWGLFLAEANFSYETDEVTGQTGTLIKLDEPHDFEDPFPFKLNERDVDITSVVITDETGTIFYEEGVDYTVDEIGDEVEITVIPDQVPFPITDGDALLVDYRYEVVGAQTEDIARQEFRLEQQFDNGLSVYLRNRSRDRQIDSDVDPDLSDQTTETMTYGAKYQFKRVTFSAEHSETDSTLQSVTSDRLAVRTYWPLSAKTSFTGSISQTWLDTVGENARSSTLFRADGRIRTRLSRYLTLIGRTEYRQEDNSDIGPTNGYRIGASMDYNRGLLSIQSGWDTYFLERSNTESDSSRFYLNLIRRF